MIARTPIARVASLLAVAGSTVVSASVVHAADPTTADCLFARDASATLQAKDQLRAARAQLQVCTANACPAGIRRECSERAQTVRSAMPTLVFSAEDSAGHDVTAVKVTMDGEPILDQLDGTSVGGDPGEHRFTFEVAGKPPATKSFVLVQGEKDRRIKLEIEPTPEPPPNFGQTQRAIGLVFGGAAVVGAGLGTVFGLSARSNLSKSRSDCSETVCPDRSAALSEMSSATTQATVSTGAFIAAGAFLATGAMLYFTAPTGPRATSASVTIAPSVGAGGGGVLLRGSF